MRLLDKDPQIFKYFYLKNQIMIIIPCFIQTKLQVFDSLMNTNANESPSRYQSANSSMQSFWTESLLVVNCFEHTIPPLSNQQPCYYSFSPTFLTSFSYSLSPRPSPPSTFAELGLPTDTPESSPPPPAQSHNLHQAQNSRSKYNNLNLPIPNSINYQWVSAATCPSSWQTTLPTLIILLFLSSC